MKKALALFFGLACGVGLGLLYSWVINPVQYTDTSPASLRADYQLAYAALIAQTFAVDGDLDAARARLAALELGDAAQGVTALAQRAAGAGLDLAQVRALSALAAALGAGPGTPLPPTLTPAPGAFTPISAATPSATAIPTITPRLLPTRTPTPTPIGAFELAGLQAVCDDTLPGPLLQVLTLDRSGEQVGGVGVVVEWAGGFDRFFTGLKPELGTGYGDFAMTEGVDYTIRLADSPAALISDVRSEPCTQPDGSAYAGSVLLVFRQP
jgi:hypothetical protein